MADARRRYDARPVRVSTPVPGAIGAGVRASLRGALVAGRAARVLVPGLRDAGALVPSLRGARAYVPSLRGAGARVPSLRDAGALVPSYLGARAGLFGAAAADIPCGATAGSPCAGALARG